MTSNDRGWKGHGLNHLVNGWFGHFGSSRNSRICLYTCHHHHHLGGTLFPAEKTVAILKGLAWEHRETLLPAKSTPVPLRNRVYAKVSVFHYPTRNPRPNFTANPTIFQHPKISCSKVMMQAEKSPPQTTHPPKSIFSRPPPHWRRASERPPVPCGSNLVKRLRNSWDRWRLHTWRFTHRIRVHQRV